MVVQQKQQYNLKNGGTILTPEVYDSLHAYACSDPNGFVQRTGIWLAYARIDLPFSSFAYSSERCPKSPEVLLVSKMREMSNGNNDVFARSPISAYPQYPQFALLN